jgi:mycothiol maleylpyruvate isomerase-like protein
MEIERSREAEAFLEFVEATEPQALSACDGWTTREVAAHVLGIAVEVVRHLEPYLQGDPVPATRSFEEREAPLRAAGHQAVLDRLADEDERMRRVIGDVLEREPDAVIPWTGRHMAVAKFLPHLRNEYALHRWDIAGDDEISQSILGAPDLVEHSVGELGHILLVAGRRRDPAPKEDFRVTLTSAGQPDLCVEVHGGTARLAWCGGTQGDAARRIEFDSAARHLFIWGRRPDRRGRVRSQVPPSELARAQTLLSGY